MKFATFTICVLVLFALQINVAHAKAIGEYKAEADQYYKEQNFKKAYKIYYKLAKSGDHYSQAQVSKMYANGNGKEVDLEEAYAWSVLASESGSEEQLEMSNDLLELSSDKSLAHKEAEKLKSKYGKDALESKARRREAKQSTRCTGTRIGCSGGG